MPNALHATITSFKDTVERRSRFIVRFTEGPSVEVSLPDEVFALGQRPGDALVDALHAAIRDGTARGEDRWHATTGALFDWAGERVPGIRHA